MVALQREKEVVRLRVAIGTRLVIGSALISGTPSYAIAMPVQGPGLARLEVADARVRAAALDQLVARLEFAYVFPAKARAVAARLARDRRTLLAIDDPKQFAVAVQQRLKEETNDVHLAFFHDPGMNARLSAPAQPEAAVAAAPAKSLDNYGFHQLSMLTGNVGLLQLDEMADVTAESGARAAAAMAFFSEADAIIIDLRKNPGGSGRMNQLLSSYFFPESDDKWLVSNKNRSEGTFVQEWTLPYVPGKRLPTVPLYFLVSSLTGSAAEGFAYNLQALGRALVVGEATAGGAHSGAYVPLPGGFVAFIPSGQTINPITNGNWEGTGVKPDAAVSSRLAPDKALELIWRDRFKKAATGSPEADLATWQLAYFEAKLTPVPLPADAAALVGTYGDKQSQVTLADGTLFYADKGQAVPNRLLPLRNHDFVVEGRDYYGPGTNRLRFIREADGRVTGLQELIRHQLYAVATFDQARR